MVKESRKQKQKKERNTRNRQEASKKKGECIVTEAIWNCITIWKQKQKEKEIERVIRKKDKIELYSLMCYKRTRTKTKALYTKEVKEANNEKNSQNLRGNIEYTVEHNFINKITQFKSLF